jgi:hypothetical protein
MKITPVYFREELLRFRTRREFLNRTKKLLIGLVTVAAMPAFADNKTTSTSSGEGHLEPLFKANLQYRSESQSDAVVVAEGREGVYFGSGGLIIGTILNIMNLVGIQSQPQLVIKGFVILVAVFFSSGDGPRRLLRSLGLLSRKRV